MAIAYDPQLTELLSRYLPEQPVDAASDMAAGVANPARALPPGDAVVPDGVQVPGNGAPMAGTAVPLSPGGIPLTPAYQAKIDAFKTYADAIKGNVDTAEKRLGDYEKQATDVLNGMGAGQVEGIGSALRPLVNAIAGFARPNQWTAGMVANGQKPVDMMSGYDQWIRGLREQRAENEQKARAKLDMMKSINDARNGLDDQRLKTSEIGVRQADIGIDAQNRADDQRNKDREYSLRAQAEANANARHAESLAVQRETLAQQERIAQAKSQSEVLSKIRDVAGKYGEKTAENLSDTLFKLENDELYKNANKMANSANTVKKLLDTNGGFAEIGALVQALRAMGDSGVISDSDMNRNIAGSLDAFSKWLAPIISSGVGGLTAQQKDNIRAAMNSIVSSTDSVVTNRREQFRDLFDRTENMRYEQAKKVYGELPGMGRIQGDDLDRAFSIGAKKEQPAASPPSASPSGTQKLGDMDTNGLLNLYANSAGAQKIDIARELLRRGVLK